MPAFQKKDRANLIFCVNTHNLCLTVENTLTGSVLFLISPLLLQLVPHLVSLLREVVTGWQRRGLCKTYRKLWTD